MTDILFTPAALIDLLSKIDELRDQEIGLTETIDGDILLQIGESSYNIDTDTAEAIDVDEDIVDAVDSLNVETYEALDAEDNVYLDLDQPIESGIIKQLAKTLLIGGLVRLGFHELKK